MKTFNENVTLADFNAWSGGTGTKNTILKHNKGDEFDNLIEDCCPYCHSGNWVKGCIDEKEEVVDEKESKQKAK